MELACPSKQTLYLESFLTLPPQDLIGARILRAEKWDVAAGRRGEERTNGARRQRAARSSARPERPRSLASLAQLRPGAFRMFPSSEPLKCPIMLLLFIISNSNTHSTAGGKEYSLVIKVMKYSFLLPFQPSRKRASRA